jgi:hypothetical protein
VKALSGDMAMDGIGILSHSIRDGLVIARTITPIWSVGQ